jgi:hypothetical protein
MSSPFPAWWPAEARRVCEAAEALRQYERDGAPAYLDWDEYYIALYAAITAAHSAPATPPWEDEEGVGRGAKAICADGTACSECKDVARAAMEPKP